MTKMMAEPRGCAGFLLGLVLGLLGWAVIFGVVLLILKVT